MSFSQQVRRGHGPFWGTLRRAAKAVLHAHVPVTPLTRPLFAGLYRLHVAGREGLAAVLRFVWYEPLFRSQCAAVGAEFRMEQLPYIQGRGRIVFGRRVRLSGKPSFSFSTARHAAPEVVIGDGTFVGHQCGFTVGRSVRIGDRCLLATGVQVYDMDGHPLDACRRQAGEPTPPEGIRPVVLSDDVWVGAGAVILKGVTIGDRAVVAARAVVTRDVPADSVVAGNPARVVKQLAAPDVGVPHSVACLRPEDALRPCNRF
jgi:acetyltransferase-like isoleucine patch superfamily enzyme